MIHPVVVNPVLSPVVRVTDPVRWRAGKLAPEGAILHWDADLDAFAEQTGGPHTFNHAVLSPQYQRNADGSYTDVGAKPAVDTFDGEKWLRSCGAVTNLANTNTRLIATGTIPPTITSDTTHLGVACHAITFTPSNTSLWYAGCRAQGRNALVTELLTYTGSYAVSISRPLVGEERVYCGWTGTTGFSNPTYISVDNSSAFFDKYVLLNNTHTVPSGLSGIVYPVLFLEKVVTSDLTVYIHSAQLTQTPYPVPYTPPGTTMPASNATTTNGMWFTLPNGSPLWKALTGSPLTLATRVRMGVGSGDLASSTYQHFASASATSTHIVQHSYIFSNGVPGIVRSSDGSGTPSSEIYLPWPRNAIINRITQVSADGTQYRVGYMIEGTHTTIQWSVWANYDGSFDPSTLYRLMLGYNNRYPMWFNKITAWKKQATDAEILEAMA